MILKWKKNPDKEDKRDILNRVGTILLDEIHERTLMSDICLGSLFEILE